MSKKTRERAILRAVYDETCFANVVESECPDFRLQHHAGSWFGVEVTEVYASASEARLENVPSYVEDLIAGRPHRHKDDIDVLNVGEAEIERPTERGTYVPIGRSPVVFHEQLSPSAFAERVARTIEVKSSKAQWYASDLTHVNLVISDRANIFATLPVERFYASVAGRGLRSALRRTPFAEVSIITYVQPSRMLPASSLSGGEAPAEIGGSAQRRIIPLRMLLLWAEAYTHNRAVAEYRASEEPDVVAADLPSFAEVLCHQGATVYVCDTETGEPEVVLGNSGLVIRETGGVVLHDHADHGLPADAKQLCMQPIVSPSHAKFYEYYEAYSDRHPFSAPLSFPARTES